jgi:nucleoid DNA-binding protein
VLLTAIFHEANIPNIARPGERPPQSYHVVESMLAVLGESVAAGRQLDQQPFGKLRINRRAEKPNVRMPVCKLRQSTRADRGKTPLAETAEEG